MSMFDAKRPVRLLAPVALAALLVVGLSACEDPPPEPGTPVLQIHGTKPPSIDLSLRIRYKATTEQQQCQKFTMRIIGYVPIEPVWHVWPQEPPSKKPDHRYRVVPMDTTVSLPDSLQKYELEPYQWTVNAGWGGEPKGCRFRVKYATLVFRYNKKNKKVNRAFEESEVVGEVNFKSESKCVGIEKSQYIYGIEKLINVECKWGGFEISIHDREKLECGIYREKASGYCIRKPIKDTVNLNINTRYINSP